MAAASSSSSSATSDTHKRPVDNDSDTNDDDTAQHHQVKRNTTQTADEWRPFFEREPWNLQYTDAGSQRRIIVPGYVPDDGELRVHHYQRVLNAAECEALNAHVGEMLFTNVVTFLYNKLRRGHNYYRYFGDAGLPPYRFSSANQTPLPVCAWTPELLALRDRVYEFVHAQDKLMHGDDSRRWAESRKPNSLLINYYCDASSDLSFHSDSHPHYGDDFDVPSLSLGATRKIVFRRKNDHSVKREISQESGDLVLMVGTSTQRAWEHGIPPMKSNPHAHGQRFNFTFRTVYPALVEQHPPRTMLTPEQSLREREARAMQITVMPS